MPESSSTPPSSPSKRTEVIYGIDNVINAELQFLSNSKKRIDTCMNYTRPQLAIVLEAIKKAFLGAKSRSVGLRYVTEITKDNISYCKELMTIVDELRHLEGIKGNFMLSESEYLAPVILFEKGKVASQIICSNLKEIVEQQQYFFDTLWKKAIPAEDRISELEHGVESHFIETIRDPIEVQMIGFILVQSATEEILIIFSTANAFYRQVVAAGAMRLLKEAASERNVKIKILTPKDDRINKIVQELLQEQQELEEQQQRRRIDIRYIEPAQQTKVSVIVVDRKLSLAVELKDDTKNNSYEAIGLATYSNSKSTVLSYASIFESLWTQAELYERLKVHDKVQREFINIAAHELRTPIQPILGLTGFILSKKREGGIKEEEELLLLNTIARNATRLQRLTEDILDITRIDSQSLQLKKEQFNLNDLISGLVEEFSNRLKKNNNNRNVKLLYKATNRDNIIFVEADKSRLAQVISNLISNAVKFTKEGAISITLEEKKKGEEQSDQVVISVKDTGNGIDPEILPRLFSKFATTSETGTGLGLFISKSIVEAHGGKIWAENNNNYGERGATFTFTLPLRVTHD